MPPIQYIDEPNLIVPLAASYNTRGILGYTQAVTNADDQLKINSVYEPVMNSATGKATLYLCKRPGVTEFVSTFSTSSNVSYLYEGSPGNFPLSGSGAVIFYTDGNDVRAAGRATSTNITTNAVGYAPAFADSTLVSGKRHLVVQLRAGTGTSATQTVWWTSSTTMAAGVFQEVAGVGQPFGKMEFMDGYGFVLSGHTTIRNSALNTISTWAAANYISRQVKQDLGSGLARLGKQLIAFGESTMEVFRNAGNPFGSPLESVPHLSQNYGLADTNVAGMRHYYAELGGRIYWRGTNPHGVFAYNGENVEKISTPAIDKILAERQHYFVGRIGFSGQTAIVIGLDLVTATTQRALLFFPSWKDWFIWESTTFIPQTNGIYENLCLGTSGNQHRLYAIATSTSTFQDDGANYTWTHQFKLPKRGNSFQKMDMFGLVGDTASTSHLINVQFSDDDYASFTTARTIDMSGTDKMITRCGGYRSRAVKLSYAGDQQLRIEAAMARVS